MEPSVGPTEKKHSRSDAPLISVVITCYNQARFLAEAIESVSAQTYRNYEIVVVDDGSTDQTAAVTAAYPSITYVRQRNQGLAAARNSGWRVGRGDSVVFLDADDRLLPEALAAGMRCLQEHPGCAFTSGHFRYIKADGTFLREWPSRGVEQDHYLAFLKGNYIAMHATVMYRRSALERAGGFDISLDACEDYDLYLRLAREHPVCSHRTVVAEYRQHSGNMSGDAALMLRTSVDVLRSQAAYVSAEATLRKALNAGLKSWVTHYGKHLIWQFLRFCLRGDSKSAARAMVTLFRYGPYYFYGLRH